MSTLTHQQELSNIEVCPRSPLQQRHPCPCNQTISERGAKQRQLHGMPLLTKKQLSCRRPQGGCIVIAAPPSLTHGSRRHASTHRAAHQRITSKNNLRKSAPSAGLHRGSNGGAGQARQQRVDGRVQLGGRRPPAAPGGSAPPRAAPPPRTPSRPPCAAQMIISDHCSGMNIVIQV